MKRDILKKQTNASKAIDAVEANILAQEQVEIPLKHLFTPGLYVREIFIPKGTVLTSKLHKTEHPFMVSMGCISVFTEAEGEVMIKAPYTGVTKPGTRRIIYAHEDTFFTTFHPNPDNCEDLEELESRIIEPYTNSLILNKEKEAIE